MRKIFTILFFICSIFTSGFASPQGRSPIEDVVYAFRNNKIQELSRNFDNFVPISINNNASNYSRNQAEVVFRDFFDRNPVKDFNVMDTGTPSGGTKSMIATFNSGNTKYTLYIVLKIRDGGYTIKEVRISKE